jgi:hypothetical protein
MLIRLSGANPEILRQFRAERGIYTGIALAILGTGMIAGLSMWFALHTALAAPLVPAIILAVGWALFIMSIDRWLVVSLKRQPSWKGRHYLLWASPRLILAALFGIIISTPITLQIFNSEINAQLVQMHGAALVAFDHGPLEKLNAQIESDQATVNNLTTLSKTGGTAQNPANDPRVQAATKQLDSDQASKAYYYLEWWCQLYGHAPGFSQQCPAGTGPLMQGAEQQYEDYKNRVTADENTINTLTSDINATSARDQKAKELQALSELPAARQQLAADTNQKLAQVAAFNSTNRNNNGILDRIGALNQIAATNIGLNAARWLLFLFFVTIDCLPVLTKIFHNIAPMGSYETALAKDEAIQVKATGQISQRRLDDEEAHTKARAEAHRRLEDEAIAAEEQLLREEIQRRSGVKRPSAATGGPGRRGSAGWPWSRFPNGGARAGGPVRPRTNIQQFDPSRVNGRGPTS